MQRVTLKFSSLQALSDCLSKLHVEEPTIDYYNYTFTAELTEMQLSGAKECGAEITPGTLDTVLPEEGAD